jgi:hypothetical protein
MLEKGCGKVKKILRKFFKVGILVGTEKAVWVQKLEQ